MSILQDQTSNYLQLNKCKKEFLQSQITWMTSEYQYLCNLIDIEKNRLENGQNNDQKSIAQQKNKHKIDHLLQSRRQKFQQLKNNYKGYEGDLNTQSFLTLVLNYQQKITRLQNGIKDRQNQLQIIQVNKDEQENGHQQLQIKNVSSIDISYRLLDKLKIQILSLKTKKNRLQNNLQCIKSSLIEQSRSIYSNSSTINKHSDVQNVDKYKKSEQVSIFQKILLLLKKKQYQNSYLQNRISSIKKSIQKKQGINNILEQQIANGQWRCIDNIDHLNHYSDHQQNIDITIMQRNLNNCSFSFDISKFIKPMKR